MDNDKGNWQSIKAFADQWYPPNLGLIIVPYSYNLTFTTLAVATAQTQTLNITANADFVHVRTGFRTNLAGATQSIANIPYALARIMITDSGSNEQFMAQPVDLFNYCTVTGPNGHDDHVYPRVITGRSSLTVTLTPYEAAQTPSVDVAFIGVLVRTYPLPAGQLRG